MSRENVKKFYETVTEDDGLRLRLSELFNQYQGQEIDEAKRAVLVEELVLPVAAEKGLPFTLEELKEYEETIRKERATGELSADELDAVAGGFGGAAGFCIVIGVGGYVGAGLCLIIGV
jgi:hypothetical protein